MKNGLGLANRVQVKNDLNRENLQNIDSTGLFVTNNNDDTSDVINSKYLIARYLLPPANERV